MDNYYRPRRRRRKTSLFSKIAVVLVLLVIFAGYKYLNIYSPVDTDDQSEIVFTVEKGESAQTIANKLLENDLIRSDLAFRWYVRQNSLGTALLAGRFNLKRSMTTGEIAQALTNSSSEQISITIQEGLRVRDIDKKLASQSLINAGEFIAATQNFSNWSQYPFLKQSSLQNLSIPLEGYIYPDTYFVDPNNFTSEFLINSALDNFGKKIAPFANELGQNIDEIVIMASIIENEVFGLKDRKLVSGILWKRHENGWGLGADATLLYITDDRVITAQDLDLDSPYNTRKFRGLPPGPISNPSIESIQASLEPTASEYWFYLTTLDTGAVIYAKTNEEHNANKRKYL